MVDEFLEFRRILSLAFLGREALSYISISEKKDGGMKIFPLAPPAASRLPLWAQLDLVGSTSKSGIGQINFGSFFSTLLPSNEIYYYVSEEGNPYTTT